MRRLILISGFILCLPLMSVAQNHPKAEVSIGYSYLRGDFDANFHGWNVSVAGNLNRWFGVAGDVSGHYLENGASLHLFLVGPRFTYRNRENDRVNPYIQTMVGAAYANSTFLDKTAFGLTVGGGVDVKVHRRVAIRIVEANYLLTRYFDENQHNGRLSAGVVWRFGVE